MKSFEDIKGFIQTEAIDVVKTGRAYIVCSVFARFSILLVETADECLDVLKNQLADIVERISIIEKDSPLLQEINHKDFVPPIRLSDNVFYVDRHIGMQNWEIVNKYNSNVPITAFYSFKGGLGRTTSLVLSGIQLARQGKKVVLIDFDLEAPGLATLFSNDFPQIDSFKGVTDYIVDLLANKYDEADLDLNDYYCSIARQDIVGSQGGELLIFPATITNGEEKLYLSKFSKVNSYFQSNVKFPIDYLLRRIENNLKPDAILIDTRTGLNDLGGLFLTRYATQSFLFFYGNRQNMFGLESILPKLRAINSKFYLVNSPVPPSPLAEEERDYFLEKSYTLFTELYYENESAPYIYDETAAHFPIEVPYNSLAVLLNNSEKLKSLLAEDSGTGNVYHYISTLIAGSPVSEIQKAQSDSAGEVENLLRAFNSISPNKSAAGEYEFGSILELKSNFYPRKDYKFIFDRNKYLILGEKGAGKTALYAVLSNNEYAKDLARFCEAGSNETEGTTWIKGLDNTKEHPNESVFESLSDETEKTYRNFWKLLLIRSIETDLSKTPRDWVTFINEARKANPIAIDGEIDKICEKLNQENKYITIIYDYLDVLIREDSGSRGKILSALLEIWRSIQSRQSRLSTKIFMRNDIFEREVSLTDKVKLNNHSSLISWEYDQLLNIIWKRLYHSQYEKPKWIIEEIKKDQFISDSLGIVPELTENENRLLLQNLLGQYMGGNNKAFPYNWILYHISDTKRQIQPRSLLNLFSEASKKQLEDPNDVPGEFPLKPRNMEMAMHLVSKHRVEDIKEEYPNLKPIFDNLKDYHQQFPIEESALNTALAKLTKDHTALAEMAPANIIKRLEDIGVLYEYKFTLKNKEKRYHIPDLYLIEMGLKRKGPGAHKALFGKK